MDASDLTKSSLKRHEAHALQLIFHLPKPPQLYPSLYISALDISESGRFYVMNTLFHIPGIIAPLLAPQTHSPRNMPPFRPHRILPLPQRLPNVRHLATSCRTNQRSGLIMKRASRAQALC